MTRWLELCLGNRKRSACPDLALRTSYPSQLCVGLGESGNTGTPDRFSAMVGRGESGRTGTPDEMASLGLGESGSTGTPDFDGRGESGSTGTPDFEGRGESGSTGTPLASEIA